MQADQSEYDELEAVADRYGRRKDIDENRYSMFNPSVYMAQQEKERALIRWLGRSSAIPVGERKLLEIGCGTGGNLLDMIRIGFRPENLVGNELLEERAQIARRRLPNATELLIGDCIGIDFGLKQFDVVYQSTVFTSILNQLFKVTLADKLWNLVKPGGFILWYDFIYNNPANADVKGISLAEVRSLFPRGRIQFERLTLAPPISRLVCRFHPSLYYALNAFPILRTHILCLIQK